MPPGALVLRTNLEIRFPPLASRAAYPQSPARTAPGRMARGDSQLEAYIMGALGGWLLTYPVGGYVIASLACLHSD